MSLRGQNWGGERDSFLHLFIDATVIYYLFRFMREDISKYFRRSIRESEEQEWRYNRAKQAGCTPEEVDFELESAVFPGSDGVDYNTSLSFYTCQDFEKRGYDLPCKHMYRLAMELGVIKGELL